MFYRHQWSIPTLLAVIVCWSATGVGIAEDTPSAAKPTSKKRPALNPKITIGKETTWLTEPVGTKGLVDYVSAVNRRGSQGVTPANNAAVELYLATGPVLGNSQQPDEFFRMLGMQAPPAAGTYFEDFSNWWLRTPRSLPAGGIQAIIDLPTQTQYAPWTAKDYPEIAEWLQSIDEPLKHVINASERTEYYSPVVSVKGGEEKLIDLLVPGIPSSRAIARALISRAMLRLGKGDPVQAWADLIAAHRLGRLVGRGPTVIEGLIGIAIESVAMDAELTFISETHPSAKSVAQYMKQLEELPPRSLVADKMDFAERLMFVDCGISLSRGQMKFDNVLGGKSDDFWSNQLFQLTIFPVIDWNQMLKTGNQWYDRIVAAERLPSYPERAIGVKIVEEEVRLRQSQARKAGLVSLASDKVALTRLTADALVTMLLPPITLCVRSEARLTQRFKHLKLALALAAWHDEHKSYPGSLSELAPKYIPEVPQDMFNNKELHYQQTEAGYRFYSVGENEQDDMGQTYGESSNGDDLVVQMPKPHTTKTSR